MILNDRLLSTFTSFLLRSKLKGKSSNRHSLRGCLQILRFVYTKPEKRQATRKEWTFQEGKRRSCLQYVKDMLTRTDKEKLRTQAPAVFKELLRYLELKRNTSTAVGPCSKCEDAMWHAFILCTEIYASWCMSKEPAIFIHHNPALYPKGTKEGFMAYCATLKLYAETYNQEPPRDFWPRPKAGDAAVAEGLTQGRAMPALERNKKRKL